MIKIAILAILVLAGCSLITPTQYVDVPKSKQNRQWLCDEYNYNPISSGKETDKTCRILFCRSNYAPFEKAQIDLDCNGKIMEQEE
jgi:hypothetical protein